MAHMLTYSADDEHLGCFQFPAITKNVGINIYWCLLKLQVLNSLPLWYSSRILQPTQGYSGIKSPLSHFLTLRIFKYKCLYFFDTIFLFPIEAETL